MLNWLFSNPSKVFQKINQKKTLDFISRKWSKDYVFIQPIIDQIGTRDENIVSKILMEYPMMLKQQYYERTWKKNMREYGLTNEGK